LRKTWNKEKIAKKELEVANKIIKELYKSFPYQLTKEHYWSQPSKIQQSKELYCVWYSIVGHVFLEELWIKHKWLQMPSHSALEVNIWWEKYLFDATIDDWEVLEFKYWEKIWIYKKIKFQENNFNYIVKIKKAYSWNTEKILLTQIYTNKWIALKELWRYKEAVKMYEKAIELDPKNIAAYNNKWIALSELRRYEEAIKMYEKAIELDPKNIVVYFNKWNVLDNLWKYEEAIKMFDKAIELDSNYIDAYINKWNALSELRRYEEAIKMYDEAIKLDPKNIAAYNNKWNSLNKLWKYEEAIKIFNNLLKLDPKNFIFYNNKWEVLKGLWKNKLSKLYEFTSNLLQWNEANLSEYLEEQERIKTFIENKNFEELKLYLLSLEEK
jgi:tetratricopeptide (TPR) repeat protein